MSGTYVIISDPVRVRSPGTDVEDLLPLPLSARKAKLARLLARKPLGIVFNDHTDHDGAMVFRHACKLGFEGIVSKRLSAPYRSGPSRDWIKGQEPGQPGDGETSEGAMVALPDSGDTAAWVCGHVAWTLPSMPSGRLPMRPRAPRQRASSSAGTPGWGSYSFRVFLARCRAFPSGRRLTDGAAGRFSESDLRLSTRSTGLACATGRGGPYFSSLINSRASSGESIRPTEWSGINSTRLGSMG
jgi:hypothetical protein